MMKAKFYAALAIGIFTFYSCSKDWLDVKPDKSLVVPTTVNDMQALLNNGVFNYFLPALGELGADNYMISDSDLVSLTNVEQNAYMWAADVFEGNGVNDWSYPYKQVLYANTALEGLSKISADSSSQENIKILQGIGHYYRAFAFYSIADVFAGPYDSATQGTELGIPLRLSSNINDKVGRGTLGQTYNQIIEDLKESISDLPGVQANKLLPSKAAAYGLLARVYLNMGNYAGAFTCSDSSLKLYSNLIDYNTLDSTSSYPIPIYNDEVIYNVILNFYNGICLKSEVDSSLYKSYDSNDLRRTLFFNNSSGVVTFRGGYSGLFLLFGGLAVDEMYLVRAECNARLGNLSSALNDLNTLLSTRWRSGTFVNFGAATSDDALKLILGERRKELLFRGIRWTDLRRLNKDPRFAISLTRVVNGQTFTLSPNSKDYTYPIPDDEILYSGVPQNPR